MQKKKTKPIVTLASAHPDHETVSFGKGLFDNITYMVLLVYDTAHQGSEAENRADKDTKHSRAPDESDVIPIEGDDGHA